MNEADAKLKYAVEDITHSINKEGMDPQAAVTKVAKERKLNANFIKRASEVINVALHYNHFKKHADAKDMDFPIVDAVKVAQDVLGVKDKTAAELKSEWFPTNEYNDNLPNYQRILNDPAYKVAFERILNAPDTATTFPMSEKGVYEKSAKYIQKLAQASDTAATNRAQAEFSMNRQFCGLVEKFARDAAYRASFPEFESQVYSLYGEKALPYLDHMHKSAGIKEARGPHDPKYTAFDTCQEARQFGEFLKSAEEYVAMQKEAEVAAHNYKFESDFVQSIYHARGQQKLGEHSCKTTNILDRIRKELPKDADPVEAVYKEKKAEELEARLEAIKHAFDVFKPVAPLMDYYKEEATPGSSVPSTSSEDNRDRKFMLENLGTTDPVLSKVDPNRLVGAYQQALHLGPELSKEKEIMRSFLRQSVSADGGVSPYDAQQLIEANTKYMQQKLMQEGKLKSPSPK